MVIGEKKHQQAITPKRFTALEAQIDVYKRQGKLPLAFLTVPAGKDGRVECPCQTVDDFIWIRGNVCGLFLLDVYKRQR